MPCCITCNCPEVGDSPLTIQQIVSQVRFSRGRKGFHKIWVSSSSSSCLKFKLQVSDSASMHFNLTGQIPIVFSIVYLFVGWVWLVWVDIESVLVFAQPVRLGFSYWEGDGHLVILTEWHHSVQITRKTYKQWDRHNVKLYIDQIHMLRRDSVVYTVYYTISKLIVRF